MGKVNILTPQVVAKIAAGEVIERPASLVKELLENSFDAGADQITVELRQAGKTFIGVSDNGSGIDSDDIEKIFLRHATSKLKESQDLDTILTFGFRGEALYSIAAVSDVTLTSRTPEHDAAVQIHARGGQVLQRVSTAAESGTRIEIRELFFNTPARKKFLKSDPTEIHQILAIVSSYALAFPGARLRLIHADRTLLDLAPAGNRKVRFCDIFNLPEANVIAAGSGPDQRRIKMEMLLGDQTLSRSRRDIQLIYVNSRPVYSKSLAFHINQAYRKIIPAKENPCFAVFLDIPPQYVDVNVHPAKREVKIMDEPRLAADLAAKITQYLTEGANPLQMPLPSSLDQPEPVKPAVSMPYLIRETLDIYTAAPAGADTTPATGLRGKLQQAAFIGTLSEKYILMEAGTSLLILDQHAAQERITFESLKRQAALGRPQSQTLLAPITLSISAQEKTAWEALRKQLDPLGFDTTLWDGSSLAIHAFPALIKDPQRSLREILNWKEDQADDIDSLAKRACRGSLTSGYRVDKNQAQYMVKELLGCQEPLSCPHGRPTVVELTLKTIDKEFLR